MAVSLYSEELECVSLLFYDFSGISKNSKILIDKKIPLWFNKGICIF